MIASYIAIPPIISIIAACSVAASVKFQMFSGMVKLKIYLQGNYS